jgi:hypothetical protein
MLQWSEHLICHAPYQSQIIYLTHNDILAWGGEVNSAFIVIFKNEFVSECAVHMESLNIFPDHLKLALCMETSHIVVILQCVSISIGFVA